MGELQKDLRDTEFVIAFVSPLGTPLDAVQDALGRALHAHGYALGVLVRISELLGESQQLSEALKPHVRQECLMNAGNRARDEYGEEHWALVAVAIINGSRSRESGDVQPDRRLVHVIRSLKSPSEANVLREIYGPGFFLIGVSAPRSVRLQNLINRNFPKDEAIRLLDKDADEEAASGQKTRNTFELADAFIHMGSDGAGAEEKIFRIVDLLMSYPYHPPTREEHAMFMAQAAAFRSSDLSRQVGAVLTNRNGDIIASGANDAPTLGGSYWPEDAGRLEGPASGAGPDYLRGYDSNERERNKILASIIESLVPAEASTNIRNSHQRSALVKKYKDQLRPSGIFDLTEFGRAVHAEMAALMSCMRSGVSPMGGVLYCTTFPCHNCAKHIIAAGISRVVYIEPYPKSKAKQLFSDSLRLPDEDIADENPRDAAQVRLVPFEGIGPRRFADLFSLSLGSGRAIVRKERDADGTRVDWERGRDSMPRLPLDPRSYLEREETAAKVARQRLPTYGNVDDGGQHD